jgi:hypothetical protein
VNACQHTVQNLLSSLLLSKYAEVQLNTVLFYLLLCMFAKLGPSRRFMVSEIRVLRILVRNRDEVTGRWRILHSEELHSLY